MKQIQDRHDDCAVLGDLLNGKRRLEGRTFTFRGNQHTSFDVEDLLATVKGELEVDHHRLGAEDRLVFQVHYAMAQQQNDLLPLELLARYRFHAGVQEIYQKTSRAMFALNDALEELAGQRELSEEYFRKLIH